MTMPASIPFKSGAHVLTRDDEDLGVVENPRAPKQHSEPSMLQVRMNTTGNQVLIPLALIDVAASTADLVRLTVAGEEFHTLQGDHAGGDVVAGTETPITIAVHEEELTPVTRDVHLGDVVIHKRVEERPYQTTVDLSRDEVWVEHVAVDREVDTAPEPRYEGDTLIIPVVEEMLVTEKRLLLREEVRITRRQRTEQAEIRDVLRREIVDVEEHPAQAGGDLTP
ncbi:MAG: YsnF/AvaK domain-containing protein [Thermomicrobiales bacterium]